MAARAQLSKLNKLSKGKKGKSSGAAKNRPKASSSAAATEEPMSSSVAEGPDLAPDSNVDAKWQLPDPIKTEVKSEAVLDSASQPVLGGTGDHWKCNQCKVVFETGPELLDHLDQIKQAEHKCSKCHVIFEDRKLMLLHKRRFHPAALNKIKSDPEAAASIAARVQGCNSIALKFSGKIFAHFLGQIMSF